MNKSHFCKYSLHILQLLLSQREIPLLRAFELSVRKVEFVNIRSRFGGCRYAWIIFVSLKTSCNREFVELVIKLFAVSAMMLLS